MTTLQEKFWSGDFGAAYTERNSREQSDFESFYINNYGISRTKMNEISIGHLDKNLKVLEIGCNTGMQLTCLQKMGFKHLYGVELQAYAVERSKSFTQGINIVQGSGFDIPFKDNFFDLVFTSGVLIHVAPDNLPVFIQEMARCTRQYIWGFEYHAHQSQSINYRGNEGFLWRDNYVEKILKNVPHSKLVFNQVYPYVSKSEATNSDCMYLIEISK